MRMKKLTTWWMMFVYNITPTTDAEVKIEWRTIKKPKRYAKKQGLYAKK